MSRTVTLRRAWPYLAVAALVGARLASDLVWLSRTDYPFAADFLAWADQYARALRDAGPFAVVARALRESYYPPLLFALWGCVGTAFADPRAGVPVVSAIFHLGGLCALVSLVRRETEHAAPALVAAALVLLAPQIAFWSRTPLLEVPMAALIPVIVWGAVRSERFTRPVPAAIAGIAAGLGLLIKWTFVTAIAGIAIAWVADAVFTSLRDKNGSHVAWRGFAAAVGAALVVALPWYVFGLDWSAIGSHAPTDPTNVSTLGSLTWYPARLATQAWGFAPAVLCVALAPLAFALPRPSAAWMASIGLVVAFASLVAIPHKNIRYAAVLIPYLALLAALGLGALPRWGRGAGGAGLVIGVLVAMLAAANLWTQSFARDLFPSSTGDLEEVRVECLGDHRRVMDRVLARVDPRAEAPAAIAIHPLTKNTMSFNYDLVFHTLAMNGRARLIGFEIPGYEEFAERRSEADLLIVPASVWATTGDEMRGVMIDVVNTLRPGSPPPPVPDDPLYRARIAETHALVETVETACAGPVEIYERKPGP